MNNHWTRPPIPTKSALVAWSKRLRFFRYHRCFGHSDIEDEVVIALGNSVVEPELREKLGAICHRHSQILRVYPFSDRTLLGITDTNGLTVTELSINAAVEAEFVIEPISHAILEPPIDDRNCFSPVNHPEIWGGQA